MTAWAVQVSSYERSVTETAVTAGRDVDQDEWR